MISAYNYSGGRNTPRSSEWFVPPGFSSRPGFYFRPDREKVLLPVAFTCVVQKCWNDVIKYNIIVKYEQHFVILNFGVNERTVTEKLWRCWDGWKFENFWKIRGEERFQPRPQSLLIGKREDPGDEGEILVPGFTLTANLKMAAKENTFHSPMK